jgi:hypothetical protein
MAKLKDKAEAPPAPLTVFVTFEDSGRKGVLHRHRLGAAQTMDEACRIIERDRDAFRVKPNDTMQRLIGPPPQNDRLYSVFRAEWTFEHIE